MEVSGRLAMQTLILNGRVEGSSVLDLEAGRLDAILAVHVACSEQCER